MSVSLLIISSFKVLEGHNEVSSEPFLLQTEPSQYVGPEARYILSRISQSLAITCNLICCGLDWR